MLSREEMKMVNGGHVTIKCNPVIGPDGRGQSTMTSDTATWNQAVSYAESACTNCYTIICTAEHCA